MTSKPTPPAQDSDDALAKIKAAQQMVSDLCQGRRRWVMSVPARPDDDPDLVIAAGLDAALAVVAGADRLSSALEGVRRERDTAKSPLPDRYACARCGRRDGQDAVVPDAVWRIISPTGHEGGILCLWCIDALCAEHGIRTSLSLHFAGLATHGTSQSEADQEHIACLATERDAAVRERDTLSERVRQQEAIIADLTANGVDDAAGVALDERDEEIAKLTARVAELEAERDRHLAAWRTASDCGIAHQDRADAAEARERAMREALEPFSRYAAHVIDMQREDDSSVLDDDTNTMLGNDHAPEPCITVGDLKRLAALSAAPALEMAGITALRDSLSDPDCTDWKCPQCGRFEPKRARNAASGEALPFRLECGECGFDATPYASAPAATSPAERGGLRVGKKAAGRLLDGVEHNGTPEVRQ